MYTHTDRWQQLKNNKLFINIYERKEYIAKGDIQNIRHGA